MAEANSEIGTTVKLDNYADEDDRSSSKQIPDNKQLTGRELGLSELYYDIAMSCAGMGIYYQVGLLDSTIEVADQDFIDGFRVLTNFQPFLRMKIRRDSSCQRRYFEPIPVDDLPIKFLDTPADVNWTELLTEVDQNANIQPEIGPLWRAIIGKMSKLKSIGPTPTETDHSEPQTNWQYIIVLYIHHGIVDAVSCFDLLYRQLLPILNKIINSESLDKFKTPLPLSPTSEEAVMEQKGPTTFDSPWYIKAIVGLLRWKTRTFSSISQRPTIHSQEIPRDVEHFCCSKHLISAKTTAMIIAASRCHGVGVHSMLLTAFSHAVAQSMNEFGTRLPPDRIINHNWPIDLRKQVSGLSTQQLGVFLGGSLSDIKLPESLEFDLNQLWAHAQNLNKCVKNALKPSKVKHIFGSKFLAYIVSEMCKNEGNPFKQIIECGFNADFSLSNLGNCDAVVNCETTTTAPYFVDLKESYFGIAINDLAKLHDACGDAFPLGPFIGVLTFKGCINISVTYSNKWISREFMKIFFENTETILLQMSH